MELLVAADDRTGALETAATLADRGVGPLRVVPWNESGSLASAGPAAVIDLACRHLTPADAAIRGAQVPAATFQAHKTDSTLRGNWADELVARSTVTPVLLVPALPAMGRTCRGGVVYDHGRPVNEGAAATDVRRRVLTARPADALRAAGGDAVAELAGLDEVAGWLAAPTHLAVADADSDQTIADIAERWRGAGGAVVLAGPSAVVAAAATVVDTSAGPATLPPIDGPVLVACGSVHPASRRQLAFAEHRGVNVTYIADDITARALERDGSLVLATEIPVGDGDEPMAVAAAASIARGVADLDAQVDLGALVLIGGDTATAVLGDATVEVYGSLDAGTAWGRTKAFDAPIITRSGGYGSERAVYDLLHQLTR